MSAKGVSHCNMRGEAGSSKGQFMYRVKGEGSDEGWKGIS